MTCNSPPTKPAALRWLGVEDKGRVYRWLGSVRSGKTVGAAVAMAAHSLQYSGVDLLLLGVTHGAVLRNVVPALRLACRRLRIPFQGGAPPYAMGRNAVHVSGGSSVLTARTSSPA